MTRYCIILCINSSNKATKFCEKITRITVTLALMGQFQKMKCQNKASNICVSKHSLLFAIEAI